MTFPDVMKSRCGMSLTFDTLRSNELISRVCPPNVNDNLVWMLAIYVSLFFILCATKPALAFDERGRFRPLGVSGKHMSIFAAPVWVAAAAIASCYVPLAASVYSACSTS